MKRLLLFSFVILLASCSSHPPVEVDNICHLLDEKVSWYKAVKKSEQKWGVPKHLILAFIYQESRFAQKAKPPNDTFLGLAIFPPKSSAYGYGQIKKETWEWYQQKNRAYNASRTNFADVVDFIGWYVNTHAIRSKTSKNDVYKQYLAYHEGHGGFAKKSYQNKKWLIQVAKKVANNARKYQLQLAKCEKQLNQNSPWSFF